MFEGGKLVFRGGPLSAPQPGQGSGVVREVTRFCFASLDGTLAVDFGEFRGPEVRMNVGEEEVLSWIVPFAKTPTASVGGNRLYVGAGDACKISVFEPSGELRGVIRLDQAPLPVTQEDLERLIEGRLEGIEDPEVRRY